MKFLILSFVAILSTNVFADQCQWNSIQDAISAKGLLTNKDVIFWCQNCGENPSRIAKVLSATIARKNKSNEITAHMSEGPSEKMDLAYVYVRTASNIFTNVSHLVGCPSEGAMTFIQTGPGLKKVAHYYDQHGTRQDMKTAMKEDIRPWAAMTFEKNKERLPASN